MKKNLIKPCNKAYLQFMFGSQQPVMPLLPHNGAAITQPPQPHPQKEKTQFNVINV